MTDRPSKEPQKTNSGKKPPLRVAEGPPEGPEGRRAYREEQLEESERYDSRRSNESGKPYAAEHEASHDQARKRADSPDE